MNEFILNDMQIAKTNGYTAHEMLPTDMLNALFLYFCQGAIYSYAVSMRCSLCRLLLISHSVILSLTS